jgi:plastocyanin
MRRTVVMIAAAVVLASACGDGGESEANSASTTTSVGPGVVVTIEGFSFGDPITVAVGEEVVVRNLDGAAHTWTNLDGRFDSGSIPGGGEFRFTFDEPGRYAFVCSIHATMAGSITVTG